MPSLPRTRELRSHTALIADFYRRLDDPGPFWVRPREATNAQRIIAEVYAMSGDRGTE